MRVCCEPGKGILLLLAVLLVLPGCASKIPVSLPLPENEKNLVLEQFKEFQEQQCDSYLDADVTVEWQGYVKKEKIPGMLQLQTPAFLRFTVIDPLGRQLLILVSDGKTFTLVNNHMAEAVSGDVDSRFWQRYVPKYLPPHDYLSWFTGRLPLTDVEIQDIRQDSDSQNIWFISLWEEDVRHHILFNPESKIILRHMLEERKGNVVLDVFYSDYESGKQSCSRPNHLRAEGTEISGSLAVRFDDFFSGSSLSSGMFKLAIPVHFTTESVK